MLWSSLALGHAGPISEYWHLKDYWNPARLVTIQLGDWTFGVEDYLFAFAFAGLCTGVFDILATRMGEKEFARFEVSGFITMAVLVLGCLIAMGALVTILRVNSLWAIALVFFVGAVFIMVRRSRWIAPAATAARITAGVMWIFYWAFFLRLFPGVLNAWWNLDALSGIRLAGVPIEEVGWAWATALFVGPALRYCMERQRR